MARTTGARSRGYDPHEEIIMTQSMSYAEELMCSNPGMDTVRAHQLENWAEQNEISNYNKHMYGDRTHNYHDAYHNAEFHVSKFDTVFK